jgi:hypothetical protein
LTFILSHIGGLTRELYDYIISKDDTFESEMPDELKSPSNDFISLCIIHDYLAKESLYRQCMAQTTCTWFSCDHTFKIASNVGVLRKSDKKMGETI